VKFRVSGKDLAIFGIFAVLLFYLCTLITGNIGYIGTNSEFYGLSPFLGLTKYLGLTIVLFIGFLIAIFVSVSSYIFDRKKGIGFEIGDKSEKDIQDGQKKKK
jgi:phosphoglycerol transferase MdoB-like AlkP superfamily enzyme